MALIIPFKALRYNLENVLLRQVIAPPYDVISEKYRKELASRSVYNVVNIDSPVGDDGYNNSARLFESWKTNGIINKEKSSGIYIYEQEYDYNGTHYVRTGFVGLLKLEEFGKSIFPHEKTMSTLKEDRYKLLSSCKVDFSQIFSLYADKENKMEVIFSQVKHQMPIESVIDDNNVKHTVWLLKDQEGIEVIKSYMKDKNIYLADGHNRYETSLEYMKNMRELNSDDPLEVKPYDFVMSMFVNIYNPGLVLFPIHRVAKLPKGLTLLDFLTKMEENFNVTLLSDSITDQSFLSLSKDPGTLIMICGNKRYGVTIPSESLDSLNPVYRNVETYLLEKLILIDILKISDDQINKKERVDFYQSVEEVYENVNRYPEETVGFILKGVDIDMVKSIAENGLVMPQNSTYFFPKLATGLLFNEK